MCYCVVWYKFIGILKEYTASAFKAKQSSKQQTNLQTVSVEPHLSDASQHPNKTPNDHLFQLCFKTGCFLSVK
jgi:hypothetical protein